MKRSKKSNLIKIKQVRSEICCTKRQRATLRSLKLGRINKVVELTDNDAVRGMVKAIPHLVKIVEDTK